MFFSNYLLNCFPLLIYSNKSRQFDFLKRVLLLCIIWSTRCLCVRILAIDLSHVTMTNGMMHTEFFDLRHPLRFTTRYILIDLSIYSIIMQFTTHINLCTICLCTHFLHLTAANYRSMRQQDLTIARFLVSKWWWKIYRFKYFNQSNFDDLVINNRCLQISPNYYENNCQLKS